MINAIDCFLGNFLMANLGQNLRKIIHMAPISPLKGQAHKCKIKKWVKG